MAERPAAAALVAHCRLSVQAWRLPAPLPELGPGVLPSLERLTLTFSQQHAALPASWGRPDVLPRLQELKLTLRSVPALPEGWAAGFRRLTLINIGCVDMPPCQESEAAAHARGLRMHTLPASWASGFPQLHTMVVSTGASGAIPAAWEAGFLRLTRL